MYEHKKVVYVGQIIHLHNIVRFIGLVLPRKYLQSFQGLAVSVLQCHISLQNLLTIKRTERFIALILAYEVTSIKGGNVNQAFDSLTIICPLFKQFSSL